jgi:uncharacterized protein (TIGR03437 family)
MRTFLLLLIPACFGGTALRDLPLHFEADGPGAFTASGLRLTPGRAEFHAGGGTVAMSIVGARGDAAMQGVEALPGKSNYLIGNDPRQWRTGVAHYRRVRARGVYAGIDVDYYVQGRQVEFDFLVAAGSDPGRIRLRFAGARPRVDAAGDLVLGEVRLQKPVLYQMAGAKRVPVEGAYRVHGDGTVGFSVGRFDRGRGLVIDPVLAYSTLFAASSATVLGVAVDAAGNTYVTGETGSVFRTVGGLQPTLNGGRAAFVAKLNATGTELVYATFLTGTQTESGGAVGTLGVRIAVDRGGSAYVVGTTNNTNFPVTAGTVQPINRGGVDLFVSKLNPAGTALQYSSYLGGAQDEDATIGIPDIAVDAAGSAYVTGGTASRNFPVTSGAWQTAYGGGLMDGFVAKFDVLGSALVFSTFVGAAGTDAGMAVAVDGTGAVYVAGQTDSTGFPRSAGAGQGAYGGGGSDAFVVKLNAAGNGMAYATLAGGSGLEAAFGLAVDAGGNAYLAGFTDSPNYPVTAQAARRTGARTEAFVTKVSPVGSFAYSTLVGGSGEESANAVVVDGQGNAYVGGSTNSTDFPVTGDGFQTGLGLRRRGAGATASAGFVARVNGDGSAITYGTYFGGSADNELTDIALDGAGNLFIGGASRSLDFPRTQGTMEPADRTEFVAPFVARLDFGARGSMTLGSVIGAASYQTSSTGVVAPGQVVVLFGNEIGPAALTTLRLTADGRVDTLLAVVRVLFDGVPAPLLYVSAKQLSAVVPYGVAPNGRTVVQVDYQGLRSNPLVLWVAPAVVGVFTQNSSGRGAGAVLNQDGTLNTPENPAEKGSIVVLYGTGEGRTTPEGVDGKVTGEPLPGPQLRILAQVDGRVAEVLYAGGAPGLVAGVLQMNVRIPLTARSGAAVPLRIGGMDGPFGVEPSEAVTIAIK